jgi:hypothetical protein
MIEEWLSSSGANGEAGNAARQDFKPRPFTKSHHITERLQTLVTNLLQKKEKTHLPTVVSYSQFF